MGLAGMHQPRLQYRPELDGMRGALVLLIVLVHSIYEPQNAGNMAVTGFFVLSGMLITLLLLAEREKSDTVDLRAFYVRRARRLFPALVAILPVVAAMFVWAGKPGDMVGTLVPVALYYANWVEATGVLFDWVPHFWTLSVEEQFYLVWPIVVLLVPRWLIPITVAGIVISMLLRHFVLYHYEVHFATFARTDAILLGALVAITGFRPRWLWPVGLAVAAWYALIPPVDLQQPSAIAMVLAMTVLVASADRIPLLTSRPLIEIGKRSYGIYLWHFLPLFLIRPAMPHIDPLTHVVLVSAAFAFTLVISYISFRWLEDPIRRAGLAPRPAPASPGGVLPALAPAAPAPAWSDADLQPAVRRRVVAAPAVAGAASTSSGAGGDADLRRAGPGGRFDAQEGPAHPA